MISFGSLILQPHLIAIKDLNSVVGLKDLDIVAAGDTISGASLVVRAINTEREAASAITGRHNGFCCFCGIYP